MTIASVRTLLVALVAAFAVAAPAAAAPTLSAAQFRTDLPGVSGSPAPISMDTLLPTLPNGTRDAYKAGQIDIGAWLWKTDNATVVEYIQSSDYERHSNDVARDAVTKLGAPSLDQGPVKVWRGANDGNIKMDEVLITRNGVSVEVIVVPAGVYTRDQLAAMGQAVAIRLPAQAAVSSNPVPGLFGLALVVALATGIIKLIRRRRVRA